MGHRAGFFGKHILVVEDDYFQARQLCQNLIEDGATVAGPAANVADVLALLDGGRIDGAILDVNLDSETSYQVAEALEGLEIPFIFATMEAAENVPEQHRKYIVGKPASLAVMATGLFDRPAPH